MTVQAHPIDDAFDARERQLDSLAEDTIPQSYYRFSKTAAWKPAVNVYEDKTHLHLCVELAGLAREAISVEVIGNKLLIRGERAIPSASEGRTPTCVLRIEIDSGPFQRTIELPERADPDSVQAKLDSGLLWITVAKLAG